LVGGEKCTAAAVAVAVAAAGVVAWRMAYIGSVLGCAVFFPPSAFSAKKAFFCLFLACDCGGGLQMPY
jgi:hypothetical protein